MNIGKLYENEDSWSVGVGTACHIDLPSRIRIATGLLLVRLRFKTWSSIEPYNWSWRPRDVYRCQVPGSITSHVRLHKNMMSSCLLMCGMFEAFGPIIAVFKLLSIKSTKSYIQCGSNDTSYHVTFSSPIESSHTMMYFGICYRFLSKMLLTITLHWTFSSKVYLK